MLEYGVTSRALQYMKQTSHRSGKLLFDWYIAPRRMKICRDGGSDDFITGKWP